MGAGGRRPAALLLALPFLAGCAVPAPSVMSCTAGPGHPLPRVMDETSGAAWSSRDPSLFWTHNDGRSGTLYAVDTTGALVATVETTGERLWDVEDLAGGPCGDGYCLYLADTGDNQEERERVAVHRVREPEPGEERVPRSRFEMRFPQGARDVEALVVLPGERLYLVTKGRSDPVTVYRYPGALDSTAVVELEEVGRLGDSPPGFSARVSGGSAIPGADDLLVIRSYERLILLRVTEAGVEAVPDGELNLVPLQEPQGEAVAVRPDGRVVLTTEAGPLSPDPGMHLLRCSWPPSGFAGG